MKWWQQDETTAVIKFYGEIYRWWNGADDFTNTFDELQSRYKTIIIKVHCYGGYVLEGNVIQHYITNAKVEVIVDIEGVAASMGSLLILGAKRIRMAQNGYIMIHEPKGYIEGSERDMFQAANHLKKIKKNAIAAYVARTKQPASEFEKLFDGADHWLDAEECKSMKLVDEIIPSVVTDVNDLTKETVAKTKIEDIYNRFAAQLNNDTIIPINNNNFSTMKKDLIQKLGLTSVTPESSDTAVLDAVAAKVTSLETTVANLSKTQITSLIATAETSSGKKFTDVQKAQLQSIGEKAGIETLQATLAFVKPEAAVETPGNAAASAAPPPIKNMITNENKNGGDGAAISADRKTWKFSDWSEKDEKGLIEMRTKNVDQYTALFKAEYGKDPEIK